MAIQIQRREFIRTLGGAVAAWPLAARAQQRERMRRIGVLVPSAADDPEFQARMTAFAQGLAQLGWPTGAMSASLPVGALPMPTEFANTRRNWRRSRRTSFWRIPAPPSHHCCRRPAPFRSCSRLSPTNPAPESHSNVPRDVSAARCAGRGWSTASYPARSHCPISPSHGLRPRTPLDSEGPDPPCPRWP
jgi:hypothetical protein